MIITVPIDWGETDPVTIKQRINEKSLLCVLDQDPNDEFIDLARVKAVVEDATPDTVTLRTIKIGSSDELATINQCGLNLTYSPLRPGPRILGITATLEIED